MGGGGCKGCGAGNCWARVLRMPLDEEIVSRQSGKYVGYGRSRLVNGMLPFKLGHEYFAEFHEASRFGVHRLSDLLGAEQRGRLRIVVMSGTRR